MSKITNERLAELIIEVDGLCILKKPGYIAYDSLLALRELRALRNRRKKQKKDKS